MNNRSKNNFSINRIAFLQSIWRVLIGLATTDSQPITGVVTRCVGSGIKLGMGSGIIAPGSGPSHKPRDQGSQAEGSELAVFEGSGFCLSVLWDHGPNFVMLLESRIRNVGISDEETYLVTTL